MFLYFNDKSPQISSSNANVKVKGKSEFQMGKNGVEFEKKYSETRTVSQMIIDANVIMNKSHQYKDT